MTRMLRIGPTPPPSTKIPPFPPTQCHPGDSLSPQRDAPSPVTTVSGIKFLEGRQDVYQPRLITRPYTIRGRVRPGGRAGMCPAVRGLVRTCGDVSGE